MNELNILEILRPYKEAYPLAFLAATLTLIASLVFLSFYLRKKLSPKKYVKLKAPPQEVPAALTQPSPVETPSALEPFKKEVEREEKLKVPAELKVPIEETPSETPITSIEEILSPEEKQGALADIEQIYAEEASWLTRLKAGLSKTRLSLQSNLSELFSKKQNIDENLLESIHETLYRSDLGVSTIDKLVDRLRHSLPKTQEISWEDVKNILAAESEKILSTTQSIGATPPSSGPFVILVVGVNGVGKTTTIGKLAAHFLAQKKSVLLCAGDTYRAAAIDQLKVWGDRLGVKVISHQPGSDPAAVAFDAISAAKSRQIDVVLIDTAGRLHNKQHLMDELNKINRVIAKDLPGAPHETFLVIDATTGQNAFMQVKAFKEVVNLSGLCVTKLDGTAKGGVVIGIVDQFKIPVKYIGVGEKSADLHSFEAKEFVASLF